MRHARKLVFQLAEVLVTREMLGGILARPALGASGLITVMGSSRAKGLANGETWA